MLIEPFYAENEDNSPENIPNQEYHLEQETIPEMMPSPLKRKLGVKDLFQSEKYGNQSDYDVIEVNAEEVFEGLHVYLQL
jgi:hypothetical protein